MKYFSLVYLTSLLSACHQKPSEELVRFVNDQNDGWNAYNISIYDDSSYKKDESLFLPDIKKGKYTMSDKIIYFKTGDLEGQKIVFDKDSAGCIYRPELFYPTRNTAIPMRVIFDSLFCKIYK